MLPGRMGWSRAWFPPGGRARSGVVLAEDATRCSVRLSTIRVCREAGRRRPAGPVLAGGSGFVGGGWVLVWLGMAGSVRGRRWVVGMLGAGVVVVGVVWWLNGSDEPVATTVPPVVPTTSEAATPATVAAVVSAASTTSSTAVAVSEPEPGPVSEPEPVSGSGLSVYFF